MHRFSKEKFTPILYTLRLHIALPIDLLQGGIIQGCARLRPVATEMQPLEGVEQTEGIVDADTVLYEMITVITFLQLGKRLPGGQMALPGKDRYGLGKQVNRIFHTVFLSLMDVATKIQIFS